VCVVPGVRPRRGVVGGRVPVGGVLARRLPIGWAVIGRAAARCVVIGRAAARCIVIGRAAARCIVVGRAVARCVVIGRVSPAGVVVAVLLAVTVLAGGDRREQFQLGGVRVGAQPGARLRRSRVGEFEQAVHLDGAVRGDLRTDGLVIRGDEPVLGDLRELLGGVDTRAGGGG